MPRYSTHRQKPLSGPLGGAAGPRVFRKAGCQPGRKCSSRARRRDQSLRNGSDRAPCLGHMQTNRKVARARSQVRPPCLGVPRFVQAGPCSGAVRTGHKLWEEAQAPASWQQKLYTKRCTLSKITGAIPCSDARPLVGTCTHRVTDAPCATTRFNSQSTPPLAIDTRPFAETSKRVCLRQETPCSHAPPPCIPKAG